MLELVIVIVIISILLTMAISRLLVLQVDAERVALETVAGALRSALGIKVAENIVRGEVAAIADLEGENPMGRLAELPGNYLGEFDAPDPASLPDGNWYFERRGRTLVYLVRHKSHFAGGSRDPSRARFQVLLVYTDRNANGRFDQGADSIEGIRLAVLEPYRWTD